MPALQHPQMKIPMNDADLGQEQHGGIYLTPEGYAQLQQELENLTVVKRPEIADRIRDSQTHGEFAEDNSELDGVKFEQAMVENRIAELKSIFGTAQIMDVNSVSTEFVGLGSYVTVEDTGYGDEFEIRLVSSIEADPTRDLVSNESPLGTALLDHKVGEAVTFEAPEGKKTYKVKGIRR
jgi:transcription elongation factor GreA